MPKLRHEMRTFAARDGHAFGLATLEGRDQLERIDGPSEVAYVIYAATYEEAMQLHHDREGYGAYRPIPGVTDRAYDEHELARQLRDYPDDLELRRLNGLGD